MITDKILDPSTLEPLICHLLAYEQVSLFDCWAHPIGDGFSGSPLYRVQGQANTPEGVKRWSLILKVIHATTGSHELWQRDYWKR